MTSEAHQNLEEAISLHRQGNFNLAEQRYRDILQLQPESAVANHNLGLIAASDDRVNESVSLLKTAISICPNSEQFWLSYIDVLIENRRFTDAKNAIKKAKKKGVSGRSLKPFKESLISTKLKPNLTKHTLENEIQKILTLYHSKLFDEAKAIAIPVADKFPKHQHIWKLLGAIYSNTGRYLEAIHAHEKSAALIQKDPGAHYNIGRNLQLLGRLTEAEASYRKVIALKPDHAHAHYNLADLLRQQNKLEQALACYESAAALEPNLEYLLGYSNFLRASLGDWETLPKNLEILAKKINNYERVSVPFDLLALVDSPRLQKKCSEIFSQHKYPRCKALSDLEAYQNHEKIRIGYFSPDFYDHPVAKNIVDLFKYHDRSKFEIHVFSLGPDRRDEWNLRVRDCVDFYHDVHTASDRDIALLSRSLEIDIATDLTGYTRNNRTNIFAMSAAPIQIGYLGFLGTMGADFYDYVISDKTLIPEENKEHYTENIVYLPSYQVNSGQIDAPDPSFDRSYFGIPKDAFVFCCMNQTYKITSDVFNSWIRILHQVKKSVLLLGISNHRAIQNLQKHFDDKGINRNRIIFADRIGGSQYWSRYRATDLFLDTFIVSGGATSSDALRMGCPVLTCMGDSASSRFGGSLLTALNLPELITTTPKEYELLAIHLAKHPTEMKILKDKLNKNLSTTQLFDTQLFARSIESAYSIMNEKRKNGLNLSDIYIDQKEI